MLLIILITFPFCIFIEKCNADDVVKHVLKEKVSCLSSSPDYVGNPLKYSMVKLFKTYTKKGSNMIPEEGYVYLIKFTWIIIRY